MLIDLTYHTDQTGGLCAIEGGIDAPFDVLRVFTVSALKGSIRGEHAHKKCSQFLFPLLGKMRVESEDRKSKKTLILDYKKKEGYLLKPKTWCKIKFLTNNVILMVVCDMEYKFGDYIEKYKDFIKIIKK